MITPIIVFVVYLLMKIDKVANVVLGFLERHCFDEYGDINARGNFLGMTAITVLCVMEFICMGLCLQWLFEVWKDVKVELVQPCWHIGGEG